MSKWERIRNPLFWTILSLIVFALSCFLMWATFGYDTARLSIRISRTAWSDFGAHIPLIRSFTYGENWPPEYPIFPGEPIRYHFLFYALVGTLERFGIPLDWALNLPSALSFAAFLLLLAAVAYQVTEDKRVAVLSIVFACFNGSLTFIRFFERGTVSWNMLKDAVNLREFVSFAPWGPGMISAFWTLNIYTNQRHLALGFTLSLLLLLVILRGGSLVTWLILGFVLGLLPILHQPAMLLCAVLGAYGFLVQPKARKGLFFAGLAAAPVALYCFSLLGKGGENQLKWKFGYLLEEPRTLSRFIEYWFQNLGIHAALIPLALLLFPKRFHKILVPALILFALTNCVQFSIEAAAGHKFLNFAVVVGGIGSAYLLMRVWDFARSIAGKLASRALVLVCLSLLTFSGYMDLMPIVNDSRGDLEDLIEGSAAKWILYNTPPDAVFMNSNYFQHPASLAGRKIFSGWPYFAWSAGHKEDRMKLIKQFYESKDPDFMCSFMSERNLSYFTIEDTGTDENLARIDIPYFIGLLDPEYSNPRKNYYIFSREKICEANSEEMELETDDESDDYYEDVEEFVDDSDPEEDEGPDEEEDSEEDIMTPINPES